MSVVTQDQFTAAFPEFESGSADQFTFWEQQAENQLDQRRFGTSYSLAIMLFVAHNLALSARAAATSGSSVGGSLAPQASKAVGAVSVSYDNELTGSAGAGAWNATSYGQRLLALMKSFLGPVYVPGPRRPPFSPFGWSR